MAWVTRKPTAIVGLAESMPLYRAAASRQVAEAYAELLAEAGSGGLPAKSRLDVTRLAGAIPHLVLCAITRPDRCIYRVAGEEVKGRMGRNPVGLNYYDFVPAERRGHAARALDMVISVPCGFRAELEHRYDSGLVRQAEAVAFPLTSDQPGVDGFILFAESPLEEDQPRPLPHERLVTSNVARRDLIDIGFGVDAGFEDLVELPARPAASC
jgi:hypothetical protein